MTNKYTNEEVGAMSPRDFRSIVRKDEWRDMNRDVCRGYAQFGMVALPAKYVSEFLLFCNRNPRPCYVSDVTEPGDPHPKLMAPDADLRTDIPKYLIFKDGAISDEPIHATNYWTDDLVAFLLACSRGIDWELRKADVQYRFLGVFSTNIPLAQAGPFRGHMTCSARVFPTSHDAIRAIQISSRYPAFHGPPVHIGDPTLIGIKDISQDSLVPLTYPATPPAPHESILFWGCSATPHNMALEIKIPYMVAHYPGYLFVSDKHVEELAIM